MAQSGTFNFNLDIDEVIQEAMEMIGGEQTLGHEPQSARRSINLMLNDWQNRGVLLWNTDTTTVTVSSSVTTYDLDSSAIDALVVTFQPNSTSAETKLERKSFEEYHIIPNKFQTGRPTQYTVKRNLSNRTNTSSSRYNKIISTKCRCSSEIFTLSYCRSCVLYGIKKTRHTK